MEATFTKLNNGSWGLKGKGLVEGQTVTVRKRDKTSQTMTVGKVLWKGSDGTCIATKGSEGEGAVKYSRGGSSRGRGHGGGRCKGCGGPIRNAPHHRAMGGYCGDCAFDEFDC